MEMAEKTFQNYKEAERSSDAKQNAVERATVQRFNEAIQRVGGSPAPQTQALKNGSLRVRLLHTVIIRDSCKRYDSFAL